MGIESEVVILLATIIFWTGGFLAAPMLFMATMGIFRNLAGMGTGSFKAISGKMRAPGREARAIGQAPKRELKQMKREGIAWGRHARRNERNKALFDGDIEGAVDKGTEGVRGFRSRRADRGELKDALLATGAAQRDPRVQAGHLTEKAAQIEASAGAINAERIYTNAFNAETAANPGGNPKDARDASLDAVLNSLTTAIDTNTVTQSQMTGTLSFLGQQKAGDHLTALQEHIAGMPQEKQTEALQATQMYSSALGNGAAFSAMTKVNPGLKTIPGPGMTAQQVRSKRAEGNFAESNEKLMEATAAAWKDMYQTDAAKAAERFAEIYKSGGEARVKLDAPKQVNPPQQGDPNFAAKQLNYQKHQDFVTELQNNHGINWK